MAPDVRPCAVLRKSEQTDPCPKRLKTEENKLREAFQVCQRLLDTSADRSMIPSSLPLDRGRIGQDLDQLRDLFDQLGFRTSFVTWPRPALSIYKDSCCYLTTTKDEGRAFLVTMLGLHHQQSILEEYYTAYVKEAYCLLLFCRRLRDACTVSIGKDELQCLVNECQASIRLVSSLSYPEALEACTELSRSVAERVARIIQLVVEGDQRLRIEQLRHEHDRILVRNSTLSNAYLQLFIEAHNCIIQNVVFQKSHLEKYERITIYLYDPSLDQLEPPRFTFLPSLHCALLQGAPAIAKAMVESFWLNLIRQGYFATQEMKQQLAPNLERYFLAGITQDLGVPLPLRAQFTPSFPLSFYLYGKVGSGKSSFVRNMSHALTRTVAEHVDPEIIVRFVKQNLNKPHDILQLELELRQNNNDLSVMSIIQGRRMTRSQTKPGLVVVGMEEMASCDPRANPNQLTTCRLISQRFSGRTGVYQEGKAPRNSTKRGISGDAAIIVVFTSNYKLDTSGSDALKKIDMFQNLQCIEMKAVSGEDRKLFARSYIRECMQDRLIDVDCHVELDIQFGEGDTRPLVRCLRKLAFYIETLLVKLKLAGSNVSAKIVQNGDLFRVSVDREILELRVGSMDTLTPIKPLMYDDQTGVAINKIRHRLGSSHELVGLADIIDFWLARALAPAVVVSEDPHVIAVIVQVVGELQGVNSILAVNAMNYKMMKSLYDPKDKSDLRDDILSFGRGALVAVELICETLNAQLCIREIIEDTPSMTAFSAEKSALYKSGLFFGVRVEGEITQEIISRASLIL